MTGNQIQWFLPRNDHLNLCHSISAISQDPAKRVPSSRRSCDRQGLSECLPWWNSTVLCLILTPSTCKLHQAQVMLLDCSATKTQDETNIEESWGKHASRTGAKMCTYRHLSIQSRHASQERTCDTTSVTVNQHTKLPVCQGHRNSSKLKGTFKGAYYGCFTSKNPKLTMHWEQILSFPLNNTENRQWRNIFWIPHNEWGQMEVLQETTILQVCLKKFLPNFLPKAETFWKLDTIRSSCFPKTSSRYLHGLFSEKGSTY